MELFEAALRRQRLIVFDVSLHYLVMGNRSLSFITVIHLLGIFNAQVHQN